MATSMGAISTGAISVNTPHQGVPLDRGAPLYQGRALYQDRAPWRDTMRPVRFYVIDARLLVLLTVWLFVPAWWTTAAVVLAVAALRVAEARGYRLHAAFRAVRARSAAGRPALHARRARRFVDFG